MRWKKAVVAAAAVAAAARARSAPLADPVASYRIACRYDAARKRIEGSELLAWKNTGARPATSIFLHLYLNAFENNRSSYMRERRRTGDPVRVAPGQWGSIAVSRMTSGAGEDLLPGFRFVAPDDGNADDRTVARVDLPTPVAPGETARFSIEFVSQLPRVVDRSGYAGDFALAGQWFPKIGVRQGDSWNCHQYHAYSEFFADFGDYDVSIDVPRALKGKVGGTGGLLEEREAPGDRVIEHFHQDSVHDFAWTADPAFDVDTERVREPGLPEVSVTLLCQPEHAALKPRYFAAARRAIALFGKLYGPYPYGVLTMVDPPASAREAWGMEYPTLIACGASASTPKSAWQRYEALEPTVAHEFAHQYFYGMLASNEFEEAWLDEGFARYSEVRFMAETVGDAHPLVSVFGFPVLLRSVALHPPLDTQLRTFVSVGRDPLTASWKFEDHSTYALVYGKTALALSTLEREIGSAAMDRLLRAYVDAYRFRHPTTEDFLAVVGRIAGGRWPPILRRALFSAGSVDYAVASAATRPAEPPAGWIETAGRSAEAIPPRENPPRSFETDVVIERRGEIAFPVDIRLEFAGRKSWETTWDGEARWMRLHVDSGPKLVKALVDPREKILLDRDRNNDGWVVRGDAAAANLWTARAFFWTENLLDLFMELW
ncbi:MAG TPA: M1 family metallopeptidase [Thermoanaerobaculia bacterium]|nr:M1 family metallopeptidase [Thermoanaerobaculia bacterium]